MVVCKCSLCKKENKNLKPKAYFRLNPPEFLLCDECSTKIKYLSVTKKYPESYIFKRLLYNIEASFLPIRSIYAQNQLSETRDEEIADEQLHPFFESQEDE